MKAVELIHYRGLLATVLGAGIFIGAAGFAIFRYIFQERRGRLLRQHLARLDFTVAEMQQELMLLRNTRQLSGSRQSLRSNHSRSSKSRQSRNSGYDTESEMFSALDTDEEEFFDLTSDDEELLLKAVNEKNSEEAEKFFKEIDTLFAGSDDDKDEAYSLLMEKKDKLSLNANFLWRLAKAHQQQAKKCNSQSDKDRKKQFIEQGLEYVKDALGLDISNSDAHKWYAILIGMMSDFVSTKQKIENGYVFQQHLTAALESKPDDYSLYYLLGRFKFELASLTWLERKLASAIFAEVPLTTFQDAILDFKKAEELNPKPWKDNRLQIAKCYINDGEYKSAVQWLECAKEIEVQNEDDRICDEEIDLLLTKYEKYRVM